MPDAPRPPLRSQHPTPGPYERCRARGHSGLRTTRLLSTWRVDIIRTHTNKGAAPCPPSLSPIFPSILTGSGRRSTAPRKSASERQAGYGVSRFQTMTRSCGTSSSDGVKAPVARSLWTPPVISSRDAPGARTIYRQLLSAPTSTRRQPVGALTASSACSPASRSCGPWRITTSPRDAPSRSSTGPTRKGPASRRRWLPPASSPGCRRSIGFTISTTMTVSVSGTSWRGLAISETRRSAVASSIPTLNYISNKIR